MDSKLLLGLGVASAMVGALYLLLQPVGGSKPSRPKQPTSQKAAAEGVHPRKIGDPANPPRRAASGGPPKKTAEPAKKSQDKMSPEELREKFNRMKQRPLVEKDFELSHTLPSKSEEEDFITYEDGVISTDSLVRVLQVMKLRQDMLMKRMVHDYRKSRRDPESEEDYEELFEGFLRMQSEGMNLVFETTLGDFKLTKEHIMKYNEKHGAALFFSHMERMMSESNPVQGKLSVEQLIPILQLKAKVMAEKLGERKTVTQKNIQMANFQAEDAVAAQFQVEDEEVAASIQQFKNNPDVKRAVAALAAFKPR